MNHSEQDPWTWGYEDNNTTEDSQHNEWAWHTTTSVTADIKKNKDISNRLKHPPNQGSDYFDTINLRNTSHHVQHNWALGDTVQTNYANYLPQSNPSNYFNNNCQTDVENKEVAPPDNQCSRNTHQPSLPKDPKQGRPIQEQMTVPTSLFNQNTQLLETSGTAISGPPFGSKKCDQQDNMFQHPIEYTNSAPNASSNASQPPRSHHYNIPLSHSKDPSFCFPPPTPSNETVSRYKSQQTSLNDLPSQKQIDSSTLLSSIPLHSAPNSTGSSSSTDQIPQHSNSIPPTNTSGAFHHEKSILEPTLFPLNNNTSQIMHQQVRDGSRNEQLKSHFSQQNLDLMEKTSSVFCAPKADNEMASNQTDFSSHLSNSNVLTEDVDLYHPSKLEIKESDETSSLQSQFDYQGSHKPPEQSQVSNQMSAFQPSSFQRPSFAHQPSVSQQLPISQHTSSPQQTSDSQHFSVSQHPPISHSVPVSQQPSLFHHVSASHPLPISQHQPVPQQPMVQQPPTFQHLPVSQHQSIVQQPPISQPLSVSQQQVIAQQPPVSQHLQISHYPAIAQQLPISQHVSKHQANIQQPPISQLQLVSQHPPVSQESTIPHQSLGPQENPISQLQPLPQNLSNAQLPPVSQYLPASQQPPGLQQMPVSSQQSSTSHQPLITQQSPDVQPSPPTQQTQQSVPHHQHTNSQQSQVSHHMPESTDTTNLFSNANQRANPSQEIFMPESHKVQAGNLKSLQSVSVRDFSSAPLDETNLPQVSLSSNAQQRDKDATSITQTRYTPSPQQQHRSQTPSNVAPPPSSLISQNINATCSLTEIQKDEIENVPFDNDTSTSRNQMSFNFQNVLPVASSSPVPVQNIPENQERLPENHELPDNTENLHQDMKKLSLNREVENDSQIHCQVDRNQYLETGHLSGPKDHISVDNSPNVEAIDEGEAPPPGLHRLVTGQGCETRGSLSVGDHPLLMVGADSTIVDDNRQSSPSSSIAGSDTRNAQNGPVGDSEVHARPGRLVQGQSIADDTDGIREVPGEATPFHNRIVLGQMGRGITPPLVQDNSTARGDNSREREIVGRMVLGERYDDRDLSLTVNTQDDFRQSHRSLRRSRRGESSYEDEDHDYPSDRDRRVDEYKRRGGDDRVRHRNRREQRSPEYRSDEEFEDRRGFSRMGRSERRPRDFSPDMTYYNNSYYRDDHRRHRRYDHYRDEYDDYYYRENRSRPSSRTGSDYRRMTMDYFSGRVNPRPMFYTDLVGAIPYNPRAPEEYYEAMRRLDPMGYAAWYNQYMNSRYNVQQTQSNYNNDRASVHSGQSSTNNQRPTVETPQAGVEEEIGRDEEEFVSATAHIKGIIDNCGRLIVIDPNYPMDNQRRNVNIYKISKLQSDPDLDEFLESPGPFIPGVTHRNTVLQYLKWISEKSTKSSEKLLYDLIHLSVKSNGELNGLDVADLLMESYKKSQIVEGLNVTKPLVEQISSTDALTKFRELLQQGNKTEALEWAIDNGAWGHALFLASKMDERTHNNIMLRFANSIPHNDPLQTLYQLMSGHVPQASTCCADKKWSDWRPHLAMILGNPTGNTKLDRKAIIKLGDSLFSRGRIFASHFCYVTAQAEFTSYHQDAKFVLLGSNTNQEFSQFASCRAIMLTMCYEYGLKLRQANANIPSLQLYKLILATRLVDSGKNRIALQYCEMVANEAVRNECCERPLIATVIDLSSKLKMLDPAIALTGDVDTDPDWLAKLRSFYDNLSEEYDAGLAMRHGVSSSTVSEVGQEPIPYQQEKVETNEEVVNTFGSEPTLNKVEYNMQVAQASLQPPPSGQTSLPPETVYQEEQHQAYQPNSLPPLGSNTYSTESFPQQTAIDPYWSSSNGVPTSNTYARQENVETSTVSSSKNNFFKASEEQLKLNDISKESNRNNKKPNENKAAKIEETQQGGGWFGGIWEKLSIRPKNQMRLPDDSNPSIIWDEKKRKWVNLDGDDDGQQTMKPPPRMVETVNKSQPLPSENTSSAPPPLGNKYKIQKGKLMKSNYVNIMGTSNTNQSSTVRPIDGLFPTPVQPSNTNFFVPPPAEGNEYSPIDFINPGSVASNNKPTEGTTETKQNFPQGITAPTMYNPARYPISNDC